MTSFSLTNHSIVFDGQVNITWRTEDGLTEWVVSAIAGPAKSQDVAGTEGALRVVSCVWNVYATSLQPGDLPAPGDQITDAAGLQWTIAETSWVGLATRWRLECRRLDWSAARTQSVRLDRATITQDASGGVIRSWLPVEFNLPAIIQTRSIPKDDETWTRSRSQWVDVYLNESVTIQRDDRIVTEANEVIAIRDVLLSGRIGDPVVVRGEITSWPAP